MTSRWVVNSSPIIVLAHIHHEHLLSALADDVVVPRAVAREVTAGRPIDRAGVLIAKRTWKVVTTPTPPPQLLAWDLGAGETAVLAYALANPDWIAILDDGAARKCAKALGVPCKGTVGLIVQAKRVGLVPSARELLQSLRSFGFRISDQNVAAALSAIGETWP